MQAVEQVGGGLLRLVAAAEVAQLLRQAAQVGVELVAQQEEVFADHDGGSGRGGRRTAQRVSAPVAGSSTAWAGLMTTPTGMPVFSRLSNWLTVTNW